MMVTNGTTSQLLVTKFTKVGTMFLTETERVMKSPPIINSDIGVNQKDHAVLQSSD